MIGKRPIIPTLKVGPGYGWVIAGTLALLLAATHGLITSGMSVFDKAILNDLKIGRGDLKFRDFLQLFAGGLWAVAIGYLASRLGARKIIYAGLALLAFVLFAYSHVTNVQQIYILHLLLAFCYSSCHIVVVVLLITRWFATRKSVALGIILAGESLGGTLFPQIIVRLVEAFGWRDSMQFLAAMPIGLALILLLLLRSAPENFGIQRIGETSSSTTTPDPVKAAHSSFRAQLASPGTLMLLVSAGFLFYTGGGFAAHAFLYFQDRGYEAQHAASSLSIFFICAFAGKLLSGFVAERLGLERTWIACQLTLLTGALVFTLGTNPMLWPGAMFLGLGWGGCYTLTQALIMEKFAGPWLARLSGIAVFIEGCTSGLSIWIAGTLYDRTGSYDLPFLIMAGAVLASLLASIANMSRRAHVRAAIT